ncbi:MAG: rhomboid family intramembrane serine protease [Lachnospiraceae bacterium]|nr:rhomboid family intramembrane serine protease [Lachnospiraceae bacterium]
MLLLDYVISRLREGGYRELQTAQLPCRILIREGNALYTICLIENSSVFGMDSVREKRMDQMLCNLKTVLEEKQKLPCQILTLILTKNPGEDKVFAEDSWPVWLIDPDGRRIVFENQPSSFDQVEMLLEGKPHSRRNVRFPKMKSLPWVTIGLVLINLLVQIAVTVQEHSTGYSPLFLSMLLGIAEYAETPQPYRLLSSAFLHFDWEHLFNNMLVLLFLGKTAERILGRGKFLVSYLICAVGANVVSVAWYLWSHQMQVVTAGASGAVFGVAGMVLFLLLINQGRLDGISTRQIIWMIVFTVYHGVAEGGVNNSAHIAGAVLGFLCGIGIWLINRTRNRSKAEQL